MLVLLSTHLKHDYSYVVFVYNISCYYNQMISTVPGQIPLVCAVEYYVGVFALRVWLLLERITLNDGITTLVGYTKRLLSISALLFLGTCMDAGLC